MTTTTIESLLLTGAAGALGRVLAEPLQAVCKRLVLSDLPGPLGSLQPATGVQLRACDLASAAEVERLLDGITHVVHLGGISVEAPFEPILQANIRGMFHLYEAARRHGTQRIVLASSNHVTGCYPQGQTLRPDASPARPDGNYGLSKLFGEGLASLYHDRHGIESVCLRIGTATREPLDRRALSTWLSHRDLARLVVAALTAPGVGFTVAYGVSDNPRGWWDTADAWARLGFAPLDSAEPFAPSVQHIDWPPEDPRARFQGGSFMTIGPFDDEQPAL